MTMNTNLSRRWITVSALLLAFVVLGVALVAWVVHVNERDEQPLAADAAVASPTLAPNPSAQDIARGAYLARVGNCAACHTARGGVPYAGGRGIETPFGVVYAGNLTPDRQTGLGAWSAGDFWRAMHHGRSKDGRYLYPAFPYANMTVVTRADTDAIHAYLQSLPPVVSAQPAHALRFPYNTQAALMAWRALFFRPAPVEPTSPRTSPSNAQNAELARGAYLARGLGHCNACHSARNVLGASTSAPGASEFAGGMIPVLDWYAPSLHDDAEGGVAPGSVSDIVGLLKTGVSPRGSALGPMAEVVYSSTQHWSDVDLRAVAVFMQSLPRDKVTVSADANANANAKDEVRVDVGKGRKLYEQQCADCHGAQGEGAMPSVLASGASDTSPGDRWAYPPLAGNRAVTMDSAVNLVRIVRSGGFAPATAGHPRPYGMPPFELSNEDMAAVLSYIRTSWGNQAAPVSASSVLSGK